MRAQTSSDDSRPPWNAVRALSLVGKYVLIGLTYVDAKDKPIEQEQLHGTIIKADAKGGFAIRLRGSKNGEVFWLPADLRAFQDSCPGEYRLRSTGEVVVDPDLFSTWIINRTPADD
jgi:hypothetical protein